MSQENVEMMSATFDTWRTQGIHATIDAFDPDVEFLDLQAVMGMQDRGRGPEELHRMAEQWKEIFDEWRLEVRDLFDLGGEFVMADVRFAGVGRDSGAPVSNRQFEVYRLVAGKIVEIRFGFHHRDEALEWVRRRRSALSQENVEIVRAVIDRYNASGDLPWEMIDPDVEWAVGPAWAAGTLRGHEGVKTFFGLVAEAFDRYHLEVDQYVDAGDAVVALGITRAHGKRSDVTTGQALALVFGIRDGRVVTARSYARAEYALAAAGLPE